jgi:CheY-like chemotaxis protein
MARILFVDDDPLTLETLDKSAQLLGHQAIIAKSGEEALKLAASLSPDLIMTDMMLSDMNGLALLDQLRLNDATSSIPVVVLSASPEVDIAQLSVQAGADFFISKPIRLQTLENVIEHYTSGSVDPDVSAD